MSITINGTTGLSGVDGSAGTPALQGSDPNTGIYSPGANQVAVATNGVGRLFVDASGDVSLPRASGGYMFQVGGSIRAGIRSNDNNELLFNRGTDSTEMVLTATGVGIGTTTPGSALEVSTASNTGVTIRSGSTTDYGFINFTDGTVKGQILYDHDGDYMRFFANGSERARIDSSGNVGIGTTSPDALLNLSSSGNGYRFKIDDTTNNHTVGIYSDATSARLVSLNNAENAYEPFAISGSDVRFWMGSSEKARIDSAGRLLVGTSTQTGIDLLTVEGHATDGNSAAFMMLRRGTTNPSGGLGYVRFGDASNSVGAQIDAQTDGTWASGDYPTRLVFSTTADGASSLTERMRINNAGQISTFNSAGIGLRIGCATTSNDSNIIQAGKNASSISNMTTTFYVKTDGDVQNTNNSYTGISDIKLKENIVDANSQWSDIKALQIRNYNFKVDTGFETHTQLGLIAQEVELVSPGLVSEFIDTDSEGTDLGTTTKSVNYSVLYMKAVKALQEAIGRIETLEASNADLAARLTALEGGAE